MQEPGFNTHYLSDMKHGSAQPVYCRAYQRHDDAGAGTHHADAGSGAALSGILRMRFSAASGAEYTAAGDVEIFWSRRTCRHNY